MRVAAIGITNRVTMKTLTVKIPEELETELRRKAKANRESVSKIVRRALARELEAEPVNFAELADQYRGMLTGPADLSSREGYGTRDAG